MQTFDAIIIGSGQAGTPLTRKLAKAGWKTLIIEKRFVGGTCINDGCTPSKAMIASAKRAYQIRNSSELGVTSDGCTVEFNAVIARKDRIVINARTGTEKGMLEIENLTLLHGEAVFTDTNTLAIHLESGSDEAVTSKHIFIDTGTTPSIPPVKGLDTIAYYNSTTLLDATELPKHLMILGGSYIALEFGQMFRRFGSEVTIVDKAAFLQKEDDDIAAAVKKILEDEGIRICTNAVTEQIGLHNGQPALTVRMDGREEIITGSHLLVATGRKPQTAALQLEKTGVQVNENGYVTVNEYLETSAPGIYALGEVNGGPAFTHIAYNDHLIVLKNLLNNRRVSVKGRQVPYTMFIDPQLGRIGLTEKDARKQGLDIRVVTLPMEHTARGSETGETKGMMKAVVDTGSKQILGAAMLGAQGGEIMSIVQMAMLGGITYETIREMIFAHPLYAESLNNLFIPLDK